MNNRIRFKWFLLLFGCLILLWMPLLQQERQEPEAEKEKEMEIAEEQPETPVPKPEYTGEIRVLIKTDQFADIYHPQAVISCDSAFVVAEEDRSTEYEGGSQVAFDALDAALLGKCIFVYPKEDGAMLRLESITRACGVPSYAGGLELFIGEQGIQIVNQVWLDQYLQAVVPSEMPASYEMEALKAQAVCARTYAYNQMLSYAYPEVKAHVDDSVSYQVYGNLERQERASQAISETGSQILTYEGLPASVYYFSTSCGTTSNQEIWAGGDKARTPYLAGRQVCAAQEETPDYTEEAVFRDFISQVDERYYEAGEGWFRWQTEISQEKLADHIQEALPARYAADPDNILTLKWGSYVSQQVKNIGSIQELQVLKRNEGGVIQELLIKGSRETIKVKTEYNVRALLHVNGEKIKKNDGSEATGGALLPSGYFVIDTVQEGGKPVSFVFTGGGYGHGVGMSQNGANRMAQAGMDFEQILSFFYTGITLTSIEEL